MISNCVQIVGRGAWHFLEKLCSYEERKDINRYTEVHSGQQHVTFMKSPRDNSFGEDIYLTFQRSGAALRPPLAGVLTLGYRAFRQKACRLMPFLQPKFEAFATRALMKQFPPHGILIQQLFSMIVIASGSFATYNFAMKTLQQMDNGYGLANSTLAMVSLSLTVREIWAGFISTRFVPAPASFLNRLTPVGPGDQVPILG